MRWQLAGYLLAPNINTAGPQESKWHFMQLAPRHLTDAPKLANIHLGSIDGLVGWLMIAIGAVFCSASIYLFWRNYRE